MNETQKEPNELQKLDEVKGVRIQTLNRVMIGITCIVFVLLLWGSIRAYENYQELQSSTESYLTGQNAREDMRRASDYLTEQVRLYVARGDVVHMNNYFTEANETRRRDNALAVFHRFRLDEAMESELQAAMEWSQDLMLLEYRAMRLRAAADGLDDAALPEEVRATTLTAEEQSLSAEEQAQLALALVFSEEYEEHKAVIYSHLDQLAEGELTLLQERMGVNADRLRGSLLAQRFMVLVIFLINIAMFAIIMSMIVDPLKIYIHNIESDSRIEVVGAYECKYLAMTYNKLYDLNAETHSLLKYTAEHDKLSGALNRTAFDALTGALRDRPIPMALVIVDIDKFKDVNDTYGHEVGDQAIRWVADLIRDAVRSNDRVIRYGGDEFVVLMLDIEAKDRGVIERKIAAINEKLGQPADGIPQLSISAGAAFSEVGYQEEVFHSADAALYEVKRNGRKGCRISETVHTAKKRKQ